MKAVNRLPASYIISESKINPQAVQSAVGISRNISSWEKDWKTRNLNDTLTDVEKLPEAAAQICGKAPPDESTSEYNKKNILYADGFFKHVVFTVAFINVSKEFTFDLMQMGYDSQMNVSEISDEDLGFWVNPCIMEDAHAAVFFGKEVTRAGSVIKNTKEFLEKSTEATPEEIYHAPRKLIPVVAQTHAVTTSSVYNWRNILFRGTQLNKKDEMRLVLLDLARKCKMKYPSLFFDFVLENRSGEQFGLDTLGSEDNAWRKYKISVKKIQD